MDDQEVYYVDVLLPLHLPGTYTYRVPRELNGAVCAGLRVAVQFGQRKIYSALVRRVHTEAPRWKAKYIMGLVDDEPLVGERQMEFWEWMARYYMCYPGDVMAMALPAGLKLESESMVMMHPDFDGDLSSLSKYELMIVNLLGEHPAMRVMDIGRAVGVQKIMPLLRGMMERQVVMLEEELRERFIPRKTPFLKLGSPLLSPDGPLDEAKVKDLLDDLERKHRTKQVETMLKVLQLTKFGREAIPKRQAPQGSALQTLLKNGLLEIEERFENGLQNSGAPLSDPRSIVLNDEQQAAYDIIESPCPPPSNTFLLHGVTSSGKTEVYIKLIDEAVRAGRQALFLLPEIALTAQVINRLKRYFGDLVGVYHSRFSTSQRAEVWKRTALREGEPGRLQVLLGARSALFLPFNDLSLIVVDEEHDPSYKEQERAPRYNARDAAVWLARLWGARTVLGSATPSVETFWNARSGRYGYAAMKHRYGGFSLPRVTCVDMREEVRLKRMRGHFSPYLLERITSAVKEGRQVILFQNRRGFSQRLECHDCHAVPQCINCDVSLVYHKATNSLRCHYCGYSIPVPHECPQCHSTRLQMVGIGTERVEEDLQILFPDARVARMDLDSTAQRSQYTDLLRDFAEHRIDILVGTQMITKGLDFENVGIVGIVNADNLVNYPNFRSYERAFQQMTQVSGRAGRHAEGGEVIIQTYTPDHQVVRNVMDADYPGLYREQIEERRVFRYPPFFRMVEVTLKHRDAEVLNAAADWFATQLRGAFGGRVMGPEYPLVSRVRALYLKVVTVRFERSEAIADAKALMLRVADDLVKQDDWKRVAVHFDVDPY
ncbi:MAG: primosomal protein N' [Bacteroidales bacterium]|nr:primosomal protein N' [Bacteroidales bacterium]